MEERNNIEGCTQIMREVLDQENIDPIMKEDADCILEEIFGRYRDGGDELEIIRFLYGIDGRKRLSKEELLDLTGLTEKNIQEAKDGLERRIKYSSEKFIRLIARSKNELAREIVRSGVQEWNRQCWREDWEYEAKQKRELVDKFINSPEILIMDVGDMQISRNLANILRKNGILNVAQVLSESGSEIYKLRGVGCVKYRELQGAIEKLLDISFPLRGYY
jgi:hypothetical protein